MLATTHVLLFGAIAIGQGIASSAVICDGQTHKYPYTLVDKNTTGWRNMVWRKLAFLPETSSVRCGQKCLLLGSACGAFAIKKNTDCLLLGNVTDTMVQCWVNSDGNREVYPWQHVAVKIPVFRVSSRSGVSVYNSWVSGPSSSLSEASLSGYLNLSSPLITFYKHPIVNDWQNWNITEVQVSLYTDMMEVVSVSFDELGTTALTWFAKSRLRSSPWTDVQKSPSNTFSIAGRAVNRRFIMNSVGVSCDNHIGWLFVLEGYSYCAWTKRPVYPAFVYASGSSRQNWLSGAVGEADDLVISVILSL